MSSDVNGPSSGAILGSSDVRVELLQHIHRATGVRESIINEVLDALIAQNALLPSPTAEAGHHITRFVMYERIRQFFATSEHQGRVLEVSGDKGAVWAMFDPTKIEYVSTDPSLVDVQDLPYGDAEFDYVICDQVIEHVRDPFMAVKELHRVLKSGGWLVLATAFMDPIHERGDNTTDFWRFTPRGLALILQDFQLLYQCEGWGSREALNVVLNGGARKYSPVLSDPGLRRMVGGINEVDVPLSVWAVAQR